MQPPSPITHHPSHQHPDRLGYRKLEARLDFTTLLIISLSSIIIITTLSLKARVSQSVSQSLPLASKHYDCSITIAITITTAVRLGWHHKCVCTIGIQKNTTLIYIIIVQKENQKQNNSRAASKSTTSLLLVQQQQ
jgi:hypothetical protein